MSDQGRLSCEEIFRKLNDYLDRELDAEEMRMFQEHLAGCASCASEHRFEATLLEGVRERARRFEVPSDLMTKIFLKLAQNTQSR